MLNSVGRFPRVIYAASQPTTPSGEQELSIRETGSESKRAFVRSQTARTLTHRSPSPGDRTCPAGSSRPCPSCPWRNGGSVTRSGDRVKTGTSLSGPSGPPNSTLRSLPNCKHREPEPFSPLWQKHMGTAHVLPLPLASPPPRFRHLECGRKFFSMLSSIGSWKLGQGEQIT